MRICPGSIAQSVARPTADAGIAYLIPACPILSWRLIVKLFLRLSPPSADSRKVVVSYKQKYVHKVLVNHTGKCVVR